MAMAAFQYNNCVTLAVLHSVKLDLERAFQGHINSLEEKLQKTQNQWKDLVFKVEVLEGELKSSKDEVENLRSALITEREKWKGGEEATDKLSELMIELQKECVRLEEKIVEFEEKPVAPPPDNGVLDILNELVSDTTSNFQRWNEKQSKLEEDMEAMKKELKQLAVPAPVPPPTPPAPPVIPVVVEVCSTQMKPEEQATSTSVRSLSPAQLSPVAPYLPPEDKDVDVDLNENPPPPPSSPDAEEYQVGNKASSGNNSVSKSKRSAAWDLEHGKDPADPSGKSCLCGLTFGSRVYTNKHIFYFTKEWKFPCQFCKKRFLGYNKLRSHLRVAHDVAAIEGEEKNVGCRKCGAVLQSLLQYNSHLKLVHSQAETSDKCGTSGTNAAEEQSTISPSGKAQASPGTRHGLDPDRYRYCLCGRRFAGRAQLRKHVNYHMRKIFQTRS